MEDCHHETETKIYMKQNLLEHEIQAKLGIP